MVTFPQFVLLGVNIKYSSNSPAQKLIAIKITFLESFRKWPLGGNEWHSRGKVFE